MKMWRSLAGLAVLLGTVLPAIQAEAQLDYGDVYDYPAVKGQSAYSFLKIGTSPRVVAMGEAFTAMTGDIESLLSNPAGIGFLAEGGQFTLGYTDWLVNSKIFSGAAAYKVGGNVLGVSVVNAKPEDVEETTIYQPLGTGRMISASDLAVGLTFARRMTDNVSWGINARYVREDLLLVTASSWDFDLGVAAYTGYKSVRVAASARNIGSQVEVEVRPFNPPIAFSFGVAGEVWGKQGDASYLTLSTETLFATDYGQRWHVGGEYWVANTLALRGGYKTNTDVEKYSLGAGLKHAIGGRSIRVDVSYSDGGEDFGAPLRFSFGGEF
jgi:hypothetical protein